MEAHLAPKSSVQVNKITSSCEICSGPHDTQYYMENPEKAFVNYASSRTDEAEGKWYTFKPEQNNLGDTYNPSWKSHPNLSFMASQDARLSMFEADFKQQQGEMANKIDTFLKAINDRITGTLPCDTVKNLKLNVNSTSPVLSARSYPTKDPNAHPISTECKTSKEVKEEKGDPEKINTNPPSSPDPSISFITKKVCKLSLFLESLNMKYDDSSEEEPGEDESTVTGGFMIMRKQLEPREDPEGIRGISNFIGRIKGMYIFVENFTYVSDFMIVEDISSIIDPRLSQVVLGKPFVDVSNMTHDLSLGVVKFIDGTNEIAYKMPHKIDQYNSLSDLQKEHMKSVYLRNEEDKRRGVEYVINKILGFYKKCLELGHE
ncbi:hypothetical protein Tco_1194568 [Tanacetum coccineum]